jgi:hypothetical protein
MIYYTGMKKKPIDQAISEALGIEWDGEIYQDNPTPEQLRQEGVRHLDKDGKDMGHPCYGLRGAKRPDVAERNRHSHATLGRKLSEAHKKALSWLGRKHTPETIEKMKRIHAGIYYHGPYTDEQRQHLSDIMSGGKNNRAVSCEIDGVIYETFTAAGEALGVKRGTLRHRCLSQNERFSKWKLA